MRFAIIGDTHGNTPWLCSALEHVHAAGAEAVIQVGDFGFWPSTPDGQFFLDTVDAKLAKLGLKLFFAEGNHEDHGALDKLDQSVPHHIRPNIIWMPPATVLEVPAAAPRLTPIKIMFFGGAISVDKAYRTPGISWFPNEVPSPQQWHAAAALSNIDMVVSHEVPAGGFTYPSSGPWPRHLTDASYRLRVELAELADDVAPQFWFAGHHHRHIEWQHTFTNGTLCRFTVLDCDGSSLDKAVTIFDTDLMFS